MEELVFPSQGPYSWCGGLERCFRSESSSESQWLNGNNSRQLVTSELQVPKTASHGTVEGETSLLLGHLSGGVGLTCCVTDAADNTVHGCCYCEMLTKVPNFWNHRRKKQEEKRRGGSGEEGVLFLTEPSLCFTHPLWVSPELWYQQVGTSWDTDNHFKSAQKKRMNDNLYSFKTKLQ